MYNYAPSQTTSSSGPQVVAMMTPWLHSSPRCTKLTKQPVDMTEIPASCIIVLRMLIMIMIMIERLGPTLPERERERERCPTSHDWRPSTYQMSVCSIKPFESSSNLRKYLQSALCCARPCYVLTFLVSPGVPSQP